MTGIAQAKRQVTIDALARATQAIMLERGLDFTMHDVAAAAEVSRSTVFRHFATREELIVAAAHMGREDYDARIPQYRGGDWQSWLRELCQVVHHQNFLASRILTLATGAEALSGRLHTLGRDLDENRRGRYPGMADGLWVAAGQRSEPPEQLLIVIATHLSPFFTAAVGHEAGADHQVAADMAEKAIATMVNELAAPTESPT